MPKDNEFLYRELADILRNQIRSGLIRPGSLLMSESDMCAKYQVSRTSVRKALDVLLEEQLIVKIQGKGTIVSPDLGLDDEDGNTLVVVTTYPSAYARKGLPIVIQRFQQRYPACKVKVLPVPYEEDAYFRDMPQYETGPDLLLIGDHNFQLLPPHMICPLDDWMGERATDIPRTLLGAFARNDRVYALPVTYSPIYLAYNKQRFAANDVSNPDGSWTFEQFAAAAGKLTAAGDEANAAKNIYGFAANDQLNRWLPLFINKSSASGQKLSATPLYLENGEFDWRSFGEVLALLQDALYGRQFSPLYSVNHTGIAQQFFESGHAAMIVTTTLAFRANPARFGMAALPHASRTNHLLIANAMALTQFSNKRELARRFLLLSLEPDVQREISLAAGFLPVSAKVNAEMLRDDRLQTLALAEAGLENGKFLHHIFPDPELPDALKDEMKYFWSGLESPEALIQRLKELQFFKLSAGRQ